VLAQSNNATSGTIGLKFKANVDNAVLTALRDGQSAPAQNDKHRVIISKNIRLESRHSLGQREPYQML
jgi:hypothetical protein